MKSHKFITGRLAGKKKWSHKDIWHFIHEMTPAQQSFFREVALQHAGRAPSAFWGKQRVHIQVPNVDKKTWLYLAEALNHSVHITSHKLAENKRAAGAFSRVAEIAKDVGQAGLKYGAKAASFVAEHGKQIMDAVGKVSQGISMAHDFGLLSDDNALVQGNDLFSQVSALAGGAGLQLESPKVRRRQRRK